MATAEREVHGESGPVLLLVGVLGIAAGAAVALWGGVEESVWMVLAGTLIILVFALSQGGHVVVRPNEAKVLTLFGRYSGSIRHNGWRWVNPFSVRKRISLRIRNLDSDSLKVNDAVGNPVEIAAVIIWQVVDTARALFDVEDYESYVRIQTEAAIRHVASEYPYDAYDEDRLSLRANADEVMHTLQEELQGRLEAAGVAVIDTRLRRLAYAPEIAQEMLRRQQASAVVAARSLIVQGAVGMVEHALEMLSERNVIELDEERKAAMVSNLLVVLCSERGTQPVINSGSLYT